MKKIILVCALFMLTVTGCVPLLVAGIGVTAGSIYLRHKGLDVEADMVDELEEALEEIINEEEEIDSESDS